MASPATEHYQKALEQFNTGSFQECLRQLTPGFAADPTKVELYELAAASLEKLGGEEEASLFRKTIASFDDSKSFFDLGYHFVEVKHFPLAVPFLERSLELNPEDPNTAYELSLGYTATFRFIKALEVLSSVVGKGDFWVDWRYEYCKVLSGYTDTSDEFVKMAQQVLDQPGPASKEMEIAREKVTELEEMVLRYSMVNDPQQHIRDWHFIQYGGALLDFFDEPDQYVAGGRYVALWGTNQNVCNLLHRLKAWLKATGRNPLQIFFAPGRNSEIIALAFSQITGLPCKEITDVLASAPQSIVIGGNSSDFNDTLPLLRTRPDQTLFSLNLNWLENTMVTPDVTGFMSQVYTFPWDGGGIKFDPESQESSRTEADERPSAEIAAEIAALSFEEDEGFNDVLKFYAERKRWIKGGSEGGSLRFMFMIDSPVPGSHFG